MYRNWLSAVIGVAVREELWREGCGAAESKGVGPVSCACANFQAKLTFSQMLPTAALRWMFSLFLHALVRKSLVNRCFCMYFQDNLVFED